LVVLSVVLAAGKAESSGGVSSSALWHTGASVALRALVLWLALLGVGFVMRKPAAALLKKLGGRTSQASFALAAAVLAGGVAEASGMSVIVGAYILGLTLGSTDLKHELDQGVSSVYEFLVPMLFCVTGMMVNLSTVLSAVLPGLIFAAACVLGKLVGCGLPALASGFNARGALRVGTGMIPRQEVALIVAGLAFSGKVIGGQDMNAIIIMVLATTLLSPWAISWSFKGGRGTRKKAAGPEEQMRLFSIGVPEPAVGVLIANHLVRGFRRRGFYAYRIPGSAPAYELRREECCLLMRARPRSVEVTLRSGEPGPVRDALREEMDVLGRLASEIVETQHEGSAAASS
jgi:Kef-type K+ transport system membrane component KefB